MLNMFDDRDINPLFWLRIFNNKFFVRDDFRRRLKNEHRTAIQCSVDIIEPNQLSDCKFLYRKGFQQVQDFATIKRDCPSF